MAASRSNRPLFVLLALLAAGVVIRAVYIAQLSASDLGEVVSLDARFYRELATQISNGGGLPAGALTFNPLYPAFLTTVFLVFGGGLSVVRIIQSVVGIATLVLVYVAGRRLAGKDEQGGATVGLVSVAGLLLYAQLTFYEGNLVATTLVTFLTTAAFTLSLAIDQDCFGGGSKRPPGSARPFLHSLLLGMVLGAGALGRPNLFYLLAAAMPVWLFVRSGRRFRLALACIAGTVIVLLPPAIYNASRGGRFTPVTAHGGINFYIGNRPGGQAVYAPPDGMRRDMRGLIEDARTAAEARVGRRLTDAEASGYWFREALRGIEADPGGWLHLIGRKLLVFCNGAEVPDVIDITLYREACPVLRFLFIPFAVISPAALLGLAVVIRQRRHRSVVLLFVLASLASVLLFYVNTRYRLPVVPVLVITGALFARRLWARIAERRWQAVAPALALFAALLLLVSTREVVTVNLSANYNFLGNYYIGIGEEEKAEAAFAKSYELDPESVETQINYARILTRRGKLEAAEQLYAAAFASQGEFPNLAVEYGSLLEQQGSREEAKRLYRYAFSLGRKRESVLACKLLSRLAYAEGNRDEAILWIRRALEIIPGEQSLVEILHRLEGSP
jgi:4-amino-4-deoxy-L-arabinose transferase-like glycosyltransferase